MRKCTTENSPAQHSRVNMGLATSWNRKQLKGDEMFKKGTSPIDQSRLFCGLFYSKPQNRM